MQALIPGWLHAAWITLAGVVSLLLLYFKRKAANEIPDAVNQARKDAVEGDDDSLNADLDTARERMQDGGSGK